MIAQSSRSKTILTVLRSPRPVRQNIANPQIGCPAVCDIDAAQAILPSAWITAFVAIVSMWLVWQLDLIKEPIRLDYLAAAFVTLPAVMVIWAGASFVQVVRTGTDTPSRELWNRFSYHGPMLLLAVVIFPLFLAAFTICKSSIPILVGFGWDQAFARADVYLLGMDAWRLTHRWIGPEETVYLESVYVIVWGVALAFVAPLIALMASRRSAGRFFLAMILTWTLGGLIYATVFASAGPVFAQLSDLALGRHFAALRQNLASSLPPTSMIRGTQHYLQSAAPFRYVVKGGGISAMPSMHVAVATIYVLASRRSPLAAPALLFWGLVVIASVHFGYHYLVDGIAGTLIAVACWHLSCWWFNETSSARASSETVQSHSPQIVAN